VKALDGLLETVAADETHGIEGSAVGVVAQTIDRHNAGVFQAAGDFRLD
jgi:hypothetical protein